MESPEHLERDVRRYVRIELELGTDDDQAISHLERVAHEGVGSQRYDVWDVHTRDHGRWWVVSNLYNLYTQDDFKSMDVVLTFHIGLMHRMHTRRLPEVTQEELDRLAAPWRRWEQAADALDKAEEAEEFQAVGMRLREALLAFVREIAGAHLVPQGSELPKGADFITWTELLAESLAPGAKNERLRAYLKSVTSDGWRYVQNLLHRSNATYVDANIGVDIVEHILGVLGLLLVRSQRNEPERCPRCASYRLFGDYRPEQGTASCYVTLCEACGWEQEREPPMWEDIAPALPARAPVLDENCIFSSDIATTLRLDDLQSDEGM